MEDWAILADYANEYQMRDEVVNALRDPCMEWIGQWVCIYGVNFNFVGKLIRLTQDTIILQRVYQIEDVENLERLSAKFFAEMQCFQRTFNSNFGPAAWAKPSEEE